MYIRANMNIHALTRGMRNDEKVVGLRTCFFSSEYIYTYIHIHAYIYPRNVYTWPLHARSPSSSAAIN